MAREIELKLEIDPDQAEKLTSLPALSGEPRVERQLSVYYDTSKGRLRRHGYVLRVRQGDDGWVQTVKRAGDGTGLFERDEWESPVQGLQPDLKALNDTPLKELIKPRQFRNLVPVFRTDVERSSWALNDGGGTIELAYDAGLIEAGAASQPVHELELELKDGAVDQLFAVARKIARRISVKLGVQSKSDRGFALAKGKGSEPVKATPIELGGDISVADGFASIVTACLKHFRANEPLLIAERNPEALHQLRVAIRRLRTALWLFRPVVKGKEYGRINDQLRTFTRELGAARNIDVILASMSAHDPARGQLEKDRNQLYRRVLRKLDSVRFRGFILDLFAWTQVGDWRTRKKATRPLMQFAMKRLDRLWRGIAEQRDDLAHLSEAERHHLRIDTKKIRYALEFLREPLRPTGDAQVEFAEAAEGLQDSLGRLNDLATRKQLLSRRHSSHAKQLARHLRAAGRHLQELDRIGPYWREFQGS